MNINEKLIEAAHNNNLEEVKKCIEQGAQVNYVDEEGRIALRYAVIAGNYAMVEYLDKQGADPNLDPTLWLIVERSKDMAIEKTLDNGLVIVDESFKDIANLLEPKFEEIENLVR